MLASLNPREKKVLLGGLAVVAVLLAWFILFVPYLETMAKLERRIAVLEKNVVDAEATRDKILQLRHQLATINPKSRHSGPLFSRLETLAERSGVREQLLSLRPQPATVDGAFRQQTVEARLEKLSLAQLVRLLHAVEYRSGGIQVKTLRVKPRFENRSTLDVNMVLQSLEAL